MSLNSDNSTAREKLERHEATPVHREPTPFAKAISKRPIPLLLLLSAIWIIGATWLYWTYCCGNVSSALSVNDGETTVAAASENVKFMEGSATPIMAAHVENALKKAADYVAASPDKVLFINGIANKNEENIGEQRAQNVKAQMDGWGLNPDYIITRSSGGNLSSKKDTIYGGVDVTVKTIPNRFLEVASGDFSVKAPDNLTFGKNSAEILEPISDSVQLAAQQVAAFLKANPNQQLRIKGWTGNTEKADYLDGIANERAKSLRDWWIKMGVPAGQVAIIPNDEKQDLIFIGDKVYGGADYELGTLPTEMDNASTQKDENSETANAATNDADDKNVNEALTEAPKQVTIYFDYNSHVARISDDDRNALATYVKYLNANDDKSITLAGYTDDIGSIQYNMALSGRRASNIKDYLKGQGVNSNQMNVKKMGILKPTSADDKSRELSRKVVLSIN